MPVRSRSSRTDSIVAFLRNCRQVLYEFHKTLEPLDSLIVKALLLYLLLEKAWKFAQ